MEENMYKHLAQQREPSSEVTLGDLAIFHKIREYHENPIEAQKNIEAYMVFAGITERCEFYEGECEPREGEMYEGEMYEEYTGEVA